MLDEIHKEALNLDAKGFFKDAGVGKDQSY